MKWLLQNNIWNEYGYHKFEESIISEGIDHEFVHLIPFTENFTKEIDFTPTHIFGSGRFVNVCRKLGYPTYKSFDPIETFYPKELWINGEGEDIKWGDLPNYDYSIPKFVKPYTEKFFTGRLIESVKDLDKVQLASSFITNDEEELVRISDAVNIQHEVRFYVIGGKVITGSYYRVNGQVSHLACPCYEQPHIVCEEIVLEYGNIDEAFVMDLGKVGDEWKIVELNNLNSSGLYECDTNAIVRAFKQLDK
jgi:hypothetical protein